MDKIGASGALVRLSVEAAEDNQSSVHRYYGFRFCSQLSSECFHSFSCWLGAAFDGLVISGDGDGRNLASVRRSDHSLQADAAASVHRAVTTTLAAELTKMHVMDFFLNVQWSVGWAAVIAMLIAHFFIQRWF